MYRIAKVLASIGIITIMVGLTLVICEAINKPFHEWSDDYANSIENPENRQFVLECAFNLEIPSDEVTQRQFYQRYNN